MNPTFVKLNEAAPSILIDLRYATSDNFMGRVVRGYEQPECLITPMAARRLAIANDMIRPLGICLKVFDAYRPRHAVADFVQWAAAPGGESQKAKYFARIPKSQLIARGYIAEHSSHSRGSTVDLTLSVTPGERAAARFGPPLDSGDIDMGTCFDFFGPEAHTDSKLVSPTAQANRSYLRDVMRRAGFRGIEEEWWHFTLEDEPYPRTYFDHPLSCLDAQMDVSELS